MDKEEILRKLEGLQTIEMIAEALKIKKQSALNLLSKLKKEGYVTIGLGGGQRKRIYKITRRKQRKRDNGMFDILNKYSPNMKLNHWYDHQVHGKYGPEEALVDAIQTGSFRATLVSMRLFNHIINWGKLYRLAKEKNCWQKVGALYDVAREFIRVRKMSKNYYSHHDGKKWSRLSQIKKMNFPDIARKWHVYIPFNAKDIEEIR